MQRYTHSRRQGYWGETYLLSQPEHQRMNYESDCATSSHGGLFFTISSADPVGSAATEDGGTVQLLICHTPGKSDSSSIRCRKPPSVNGHFAQESLITHRQADVLRDGYFRSRNLTQWMCLLKLKYDRLAWQTIRMNVERLLPKAVNKHKTNTSATQNI